MDRVLEKLREHRSEQPSRWREVAEDRQSNLYWLKESRKIAIGLLSKMRNDSISRAELSRLTGINIDVLSTILKGKERVSEENLLKIEKVLN